jgi:hypothetical protein
VRERFDVRKVVEGDSLCILVCVLSVCFLSHCVAFLLRACLGRSGS